MNLHIGSFHTGGRPPCREDLDILLGEFTKKPFEVAGEAVNESVLMVYRGDRITCEDDSEAQPLNERNYILSWDGRLDNREDFSVCLPLATIKDLPDSVLVLKAYQLFGEAVFGKLIGEFALALWCKSTKSLVFARSACGARPLYYTLKDDRLLWCSHFAHLVRISGIDTAVNDEYVLPYLVTTPDAKQTPLAKVQAVPPNSVVRIENGELKRTSTLWSADRISVLRYRNDAEYEEHCREKISEAVRVRLRSKFPVFAELSGGLDSSSIVMIADKILRDRNECVHNLQTVSCVYEESKSADERSFIRAVEEKRNVETHLIHEKDQRITLGLNDPEFTGPLHTLQCFPGRYEVISAVMRQYDARVLLTGRGGDHLFWSAPQGEALVADELLRLNLIGAHRQCGSWSRAANVPYFEFLTTKAFRSALASLFRGANSSEQSEIPSWVQPRHRAIILRAEGQLGGSANWPSAPGRRAQVLNVERMFQMLGSGFAEEYPQIYVSHPYSHRPLVEFCLGVPVSQFLRYGQTRSLMRRALRDVLPQKTTNRVSKGLLDETIIRALRREWACTSNLSDWQVCQRGYVVPSQLADSLHQARLGVLHLLGPLIRLFSLERWLRSLNGVKLPAAAT